MKGVIRGVLIGLVFFGVFSSALFAQSVLKKDSRLRPVGWKQGETLLFKSGQIVYDTVEGGVKTGVLGETVSLFPWNNNTTRIKFLAGTRIYFERAGGVKRGFLAEERILRIVNSTNTITCMEGGAVEFGYDGGITAAKLGKDVRLRTHKNTTVLRKRGSTVRFDDKGLLEEGY